MATRTFSTVTSTVFDIPAEKKDRHQIIIESSPNIKFAAHPPFA
jgi:hypothetical protein